MKRSIVVLVIGVLGLVHFSYAQEGLNKKLWRSREAQYKSKLARQILENNAAQTSNQQDYDVTYYDIDLRLDVSKKQINGLVTMHGIALVAGLDQVQVNFLNGMHVRSIQEGEQPANFTHQNDLITVSLGRVCGAGDAFSIKIEYDGSPEQSGFGAFGFDEYAGQPMIWSLSEPYGARNWWPCKDIPADKADSVDIRITVPNGLIVASNGLLRERKTEGEWTTYWWHEGYPITTYLVSVAIYPYLVYSDWFVYGDNDSMPVEFYVFPDHYDRVKENYAKTVLMIETFSGIFGLYPFIEEKYGHAEFLWGGGMEHQTITSLGWWGEMLIAHELSHMWWGDMVTCFSFHHIWLNEGFAVYSEALWQESLGGEKALHNAMTYEAYMGPGTIYVEDPYHDNVFDGNLTYSKASWVLHMLRHVVGDDAFFLILRTYYEEFKFKTATTEQFRDLCERISGQDLHQFFHQWIYGSYHPVYEYQWFTKSLDDGRYKVTGMVTQTQTDAPVFQMPIDLTFKMPSGDTTVVFWNTESSQSFSYVLSDSPTTVLLDKDNWILHESSILTKPDLQIVTSSTQPTTNGHVSQVMNPGEETYIYVTLTNAGAVAPGVTGELSTQDDDVQVLQNQAEFGDVMAGDKIENSQSPFRVSVSPSAASHVVRFELKLRDTNITRLTLDLFIPLGQPNILLVDDDAGADYEKYWEKFAFHGGLYTTTWNVAASGIPKLFDLDSNLAVIWFTGDDRFSSLSADEQSILGQYLDSGGRLLISGQNIGYDLVQNGSESDSAFYSQYLKAQFVSDRSLDDRVAGVLGDPVGHARNVHFQGDYISAGNQNSPDVILPREPAHASFKYLPGSQVAGLSCQESSNGSRLVYLAFGLEGVAGPRESSAQELLGQAVTWLLGTADVEIATPYRLPLDFRVLQNFPNPFNPVTRLHVSIPEAGETFAAVYNALGQRVRILHDGSMQSGWHELTWNGLDDAGSVTASGLYLFVFRYNGQEKMTKMVKLE
ncbi:T9SS type A sorting domain-containing protein [candidate division KSB1 bacterium]|nr:T9SS type A sorting domain-containing protein [candidate division KSB1 bacterium]